MTLSNEVVLSIHDTPLSVYVSGEIDCSPGEYSRVYQTSLSESYLPYVTDNMELLFGTIFLPPEITQFLVTQLLTAFNGQIIVQESGLFTKKNFGTQCMSPSISIIDNPFHSNAQVFDTVDAEGAPRSTKKLIGSGILSESLNDTVCASILGLTSGNVCFDYMSETTKISHSEITLLSDSITPKDLFSGDIIIRQLDSRQYSYNQKTGHIHFRLIGKRRECDQYSIFEYNGSILNIFNGVRSIAPPYKSWKGFHVPGLVIQL